jgi:hypothetical protein
MKIGHLPNRRGTLMIDDIAGDPVTHQCDDETYVRSGGRGRVWIPCRPRGLGLGMQRTIRYRRHAYRNGEMQRPECKVCAKMSS